MLIPEGSLLEIQSSRKGSFTAIATKDFDTVKDTFWPVKTTKYVRGMSTDWAPGEDIPCRGSFCKIKIIKKGKIPT